MPPATHPIRAILEKWGIKQAWLAKRCTISDPTLSHILNGTREGSPQFYRLAARVLGVTAADVTPQNGRAV